MPTSATVSIFFLSVILGACGASGDESARTTILVGDKIYDLAAGAVTGKMDGHSVYQMTFVLPDASLTLVVPRLTTAAIDIYPFRAESLAIYAPTSGEPYTLHGAPTTVGWIRLDDDNQESVAGQFSLDLARLSGEKLTIGGELSGVRLAKETIMERGNRLSCHVRAYSVQGSVLHYGSAFSNNASAEWIVIGADLTSAVGITLFMPRDIQPGSYVIDNETYRGTARDTDYAGVATSGNITIESHDAARRHIVGSFAYSGDANNPSGSKVPLLVNTGSFSVYYFSD